MGGDVRGSQWASGRAGERVAHGRARHESVSQHTRDLARRMVDDLLRLAADPELTAAQAGEVGALIARFQRWL